MNVNVDANIPPGSLGNGNPLALQILPETVVQFSETSQLEIRHRLFVFLDLRWVAHVAGGISGRHVGEGVRSLVAVETPEELQQSLVSNCRGRRAVIEVTYFGGDSRRGILQLRTSRLVHEELVRCLGGEFVRLGFSD